jgi:hypothetical protein
MRSLLKSFLPVLDRRAESLNSGCGNKSCHNTQFLRSFPGSRPGIQVGPTWYCGVDCLAVASCSVLERLCHRQVVEISRQPRLSLGLFLLSKGYLTTEQLRFATDRSQCLDEDLENTLVKYGAVTEKQLAAARSAQWGYPVLAPGHRGQIVEIEIPKAILKICEAVPLHYSATAKRIVLGFVSRVDHRFIESIEEMTRCRVEPCFITATEFAEQMERVIVPADYEEVVVDNPGRADRMARTVGRTAVHVAATEATFSQWRDFVLVRVVGKRGKADIVFCVGQGLPREATDQSCEIKELIAV